MTACSTFISGCRVTRFSRKMDQGYIAVSDQLWAWVDKIESQPPPETAIPALNRGQQRAIGPGGGPIFIGSATAGRDFNINSQTNPFHR